MNDVSRWGHDPATGPYPRDMVGYGATPPDPQWPGGARIAVSFVLNVEEGGENAVLHGDPASETFLSEIVAAQPFPARHLSMESLYEYGSRAGVWRVLRLFASRGLPLTAFAVADLPKSSLSLADYGLDKPKMIVAFSSSDPSLAGGAARPLTELRIGDTTKDGKRLYVLSPDRERVHIVTRSLADSLSVPLDQLRADTLLSVRVFEAKSLSVVQTASAEATRSSSRSGKKLSSWSVVNMPL